MRWNSEAESLAFAHTTGEPKRGDSRPALSTTETWGDIQPDVWACDQSPPCFYALPKAIFILHMMYNRTSVLSLGTSWELVILPVELKKCLLKAGTEDSLLQGPPTSLSFSLLFRH